jgi:lipopolysaccharide transport system permease protein
MAKTGQFELVLKRRRGWQALDLHEAWMYRELLGFLVWRDVKIRYRQTAMGVIWALLQPLAGMIIFTLFFNKIAGIESGSATPYPLFAYSGLLVWTFFANAVAQASSSLIGNQALISKIYFPRMFVPLGSIGALLLDLLLGLVLVGGLFAYYGWPVSVNILELPLFLVGAFLAAAVVPFLVQMGLFITPVIYPPTLVERFPMVRDFLGLNPMAGMVEGFRHCLLGDPADWTMIGQSFGVTIVVFVGGLFVFRRWEREFADII